MKKIDDLWIFFELRLLNFDVFPIWSLLSCFIMSFFPIIILLMVILSKQCDRDSRHDTSVVTSHMDHVVGFGVFVVSRYLLLVNMKSICFSLPCVECCVIL